jgi:hypothetical protein
MRAIFQTRVAEVKRGNNDVAGLELEYFRADGFDVPIMADVSSLSLGQNDAAGALLPIWQRREQKVFSKHSHGEFSVDAASCPSRTFTPGTKQIASAKLLPRTAEIRTMQPPGTASALIWRTVYPLTNLPSVSNGSGGPTGAAVGGAVSSPGRSVGGASGAGAATGMVLTGTLVPGTGAGVPAGLGVVCGAGPDAVRNSAAVVEAGSMTCRFGFAIGLFSDEPENNRRPLFEGLEFSMLQTVQGDAADAGLLFHLFKRQLLVPTVPKHDFTESHFEDVSPTQYGLTRKIFSAIP